MEMKKGNVEIKNKNVKCNCFLIFSLNQIVNVFFQSLWFIIIVYEF